MSVTPNQPNNNSIRIAVAFSLVCAGLLLAAWLVNSIGITPESETGRTIGFITIGILFAFALAALAGFGFSAATLMKLMKKPGFSGGRWLVLIVFLVNAVLTLLGAGMVAAIVSVMMATRNT